EAVRQGLRTNTFVYGPDGYLATVTDVLGQTASFTRDAVGRITSRTRPDGTVVRFGYDSNGNLARVTPPGRPDHTFSFTSRDLTATYAPPGAPATTYAYNLDRQLRRTIRPDGSPIDPGYDAAGRLQTLATGTGNTTFAYDGAD